MLKYTYFKYIYIYIYFRERAQKAFRGNIVLKVGDLSLSNSLSPKLSALVVLLVWWKSIFLRGPLETSSFSASGHQPGRWVGGRWVDTLHLPVCSLLPCTPKRGTGFSAFLFTCSLDHLGGSSLLADDPSLAVASTLPPTPDVPSDPSLPLSPKLMCPSAEVSSSHPSSNRTSSPSCLFI